MAIDLPPSGEPGEDHYRPLAQINVTPMVDVMLVLLVIFMVTAPLLTVGVPLSLPKSSSAAVTQPRQPIIVSINNKGATFIGDQPYSGDTLRQQLTVLAAADPTRIVYVRGDRNILYAQLMDVLDIVDKAGFAKVSLLAEAANSAP
ncbi:MAG: biopolymer transporter ExbD [Alphaproteobacteria bacterium]|nr:biopolymer transporter ExbD [Alphaproteobacteria bacterium]